ncbi:hypothetical protein SPRG_20607 [Saprolegnia parasitica CBS 223.65]|uniref:Uncharacterized protein n=1 Tax=Saprolegnia parasitica (strain CBS 223.65) TaxID=695850 RepID=A0A067C766_SAPPC|nr:hypothetical protein SPRG_20607 [Saprolegnia parasitica CBS 223.65]KDO26343.1 hypothetical protein SPRG_20607 [Saprolegnia parasitica CBS 223.65]|eukprot:XP_012203066.1 hypothetical protein SPRG_20607 [Saprolegnia parasitica CBS 223.65]
MVLARTTRRPLLLLLVLLLCTTPMVLGIGATLLQLCPSITSTPSACVRQGGNGSVSVIAANDSGAIDLFNMSITTVEELPVQFTTLNLSKNLIDSVRSMYLGPSRLSSLDLSHNSIQSYSRLALPTTLTVLDLSFNNLTRLDATTINWMLFPNLTKLILRGNNITSISSTHFPASLQHLDLSMNPICRFDIDPTTYYQFRSDSFELMASMAPNAFQMACVSCPGTLVVGQGLALCVFEGSREHLLNQTQDYFLRYSIAISTVTVLLMAVLWFRRYRQIQRDRAELSMRDTCTSSICAQYDGVPMQYRISLSPPAAAPTISSSRCMRPSTDTQRTDASTATSAFRPCDRSSI